MSAQVQLPTAVIGITLLSGSSTAAKGEEMPHSLFKTIPPERVGLNGEYDHSGLAKRVLQAYRRKFSQTELENLRVTQRGKVVLLMGNLRSADLLDQLVELALQVEGATAVETNGVRLQR